MLTIEQIRAARALLGWGQSDLAEHAGLSHTGIARIENGTNRPNSSTLKKIQGAFDHEDVEFIGTTGVNKRSGDVKIYHDHAGFSFFLDDVYDTALTYGTEENPVEIFLSNVVHENWIKWMGPEKWQHHTERMEKLKNQMDVRILVKEGDTNFPTGSFSKYKWFPEELFNDQSFYSYHDRLAFLSFKAESVQIMILKHPAFAEGYRNLFRAAWSNVAIDPKI